MKLRDELELQSSETRARLNELAGQPEPSDEAIAEIETLTKKLGTIETRRQAAIRADPLPEWEAASASAVKDELVRTPEQGACRELLKGRRIRKTGKRGRSRIQCGNECRWDSPLPV